MDELTRLAVAARDGDAAAFDAFAGRARPEVRRYLAHLAGPDELDDLAQDAVVRVIRSLPRFAAAAPARSWLLTIARRTYVDHVRRQTRRRRAQARLDPAAETGDEPQRAIDLRSLVDALAADRRDAFVLTQVLGCSYEEAALVCAVPIGTIRSRVARARRDLVEALVEPALSRAG